jgi:hypothetical protein
MKSKFAKANRLSKKQEIIVLTIQCATFEKDTEYLQCLPTEVLSKAKDAQAEFSEVGVSEKAVTLDKELCVLVKKYWDKNGKAISQ